MIFQEALIHELEEGEFVKADDGYKGEPNNVKCPFYMQGTNEEKVKMSNRV